MVNVYIEARVAIHLIDRKLDQIQSIAEEFPAELIWERPLPDLVSLGNLICHVAGSMRDWIENGLAQGSWERDRDHEFQRSDGMQKGELVTHFVETREHCGSFLTEIDEEAWSQRRVFRNSEYTVRDIVLQQAEHIAYHAGQAAFLRRLVANLEATK
jgi:uncharacterized damage-inducible protein DinB